MIQASVGFQCPECVSAGAKQAPVYTTRTMPKTLPIATYVLIGLNALAFAAELATGGNFSGSRIGGFGEWGGLIAAARGETGPIGVAFNEWWRIITASFIHAGPLHLAMNMYALYIFGTALEPAMGRIRFVGLYLTATLAGSAAVLLFNPNTLTVGASGAIFGLFGAMFVYQRARGINPWTSGIGVLIVINLVISVGIPGISLVGHLGGLVGGGIVAWVMVRTEARTPSVWGDVAVFVGFSVVFVALALWGASMWRNPLFG